MGLFGSKKTYVSSTIYNMAGPIEDRPNFLKTLMVGRALGYSTGPLSEQLQTAYIKGPGFRLRSFGRWADEDYPIVDVPRANLYSRLTVPSETVAKYVPHAPGSTVNILRVEAKLGDYSFWAEQWMLQNRPGDLNTNWVSDYDETANTIRITFADGSTVSFQPQDFRKSSAYIFVLYSLENGGPQLWIYRLGSGTTELDNLVNQTADDGYYFPFIPVRLDNKFVEDINPDAYAVTEKAYKKATGGKLDDVVQGLKDNKDLKNIDYAYVMFGVSLNTKEMVGKKYLYGFFDKLRLSQDTTTADYQLWKAQQQAFLKSDARMTEWQQAQSDPNSPLYGTPQPELGDVSAMPTNEIRIRGGGTLPTNLDIQISWQAISRTSGVGQGRPGAKKGDFWINNGTTDAYAQSLLVDGTTIPLYNQATDRLVIHHQYEDLKWESLTIIGLVHKNFIYNGKFVEIKSKEAMEDKEESGFLVPLHYQTFRDMGLKDSTQLSTACCYMVLNSYEVKKTGFFGSTFFKIILVVAVIAVTVATGGIGGASAGLLGANAAVGAAIGLSGTLAIIAGAVANAIVAMILSKIISIGAVAIFGERLGAIIGAIASMVAVQVGTSFTNNGSLATAFQNLTKADSIIALTNAAGNGIAGYVQGEAMEYQAKTQKLMDDYTKESNEITERFAQEFGYGKALIDPMALNQRDAFMVESLDTFLERTLMTGSDVAELSTNLISQFTAITLSTELP